jgi:hypothetical protein
MRSDTYPPFNSTQNSLSADWNLQVGRGKVDGATLVNVQGYNAAMPTSFRAAWELANTVAYVYPTALTTMSFTSSSAETLTMRVDGLDASYAIKTATVTFTASTTGVVTSGTADFFRINRMTITSGTSAGNISATNGGVTYSYIGAGAGISQASLYTVPAGYTFYLTRAQAFTTNNGTQYCTYRVYSQTLPSGVTTPQTVLTAPFTQFYMSTRVVPRGYAEKTDIQWQLMQSNPAPGSIQVEGTLIANTAA